MFTKCLKLQLHGLKYIHVYTLFSFCHGNFKCNLCSQTKADSPPLARLEGF